VSKYVPGYQSPDPREEHAMSDLLEQIDAREWFYAFDLPDGERTRTYHGGALDAIHDTRWAMLKASLESRFKGDYGNLRVLDLASHQGFFSVRMAQMGFGEVLGIDARNRHVRDSSLIAELYQLEQVSFQQGDIHTLDADQLGQFDVVLMLGLLYHLENPVGALRTCRALCRDTCVIETQIAPGVAGVMDFGSYEFVRPLKGSFGLIDETEETHGPEASITGICLVPSLDGLMWVLDKVGFSHSRVLPPPADAYEQLRHGKRVMVSAAV
jgi:tRNA (mo5U34)-methyltransferase